MPTETPTPCSTSTEATQSVYRLPSLLLRAVDLGIMGVIFVAPLFMGGRHSIGRLVFVILACVIATAYATAKCFGRNVRWKFCGAEFLTVAAVLLLMAQLTHLPANVINCLSPIVPELLPAWTAGSEAAERLGTWTCLTLTPESTRVDLVLLLAFSAVFLVVVQRIRTVEDVERFLRWIALAVIGMAVVGLAQFLAGNGKFLWVYAHPFRDASDSVKGTFANANHFAHFLALGLPALVWWLTQSGRSRERGRRSRASRERQKHSSSRFAAKRSSSSSPRRQDKRQMTRFLLAVSLGIVALAGLLSLSRGGAVILLLSSAACLGIFAWRGLLGSRAWIVLSGASIFLTAALLVVGISPLAKELETLTGGTMEDLDAGAARRKLWAADLEAFRHSPWLGTGAGSHLEIYRTFYQGDTEVRYTHAESGYIQVLTETGLVGILLTTAAIALCGYWCASGLRSSRSARLDACLGVVSVGIFISAVHSAWDFVWYIPACLTLTLILAACAYRLQQFAITGMSRGTVGHPASTPASLDNTLHLLRWGTTALAAGGISCVTVNVLIPPALASIPWERYLAESAAVRENEGIELNERVPVMIGALEDTLARHPHHAEANFRLAELSLLQFDIEQRASETPIALAHLRDAANRSKFRTRSELDQWLSTVVGDRRRYLDRAQRHLRLGLRVCPLHGEGYVYLAELAFLDGYRQKLDSELIEQALRVRPASAEVLFAAGSHAMMQEDNEKEALEFWKRAFQHDPKYRSQIIALVAPSFSGAQFLDNFDPELTGLEEVYNLYREIGRDQDARDVAVRYIEVLEAAANAEKGAKASRLWMQARSVHQFRESEGNALRCLQQAVDCSPGDYALHRTLAYSLIAAGKIDNAIEELRWCRRRKPHDDSIKRLWKRAEHRRSEQALMTTEPTTKLH